MLSSLVIPEGSSTSCRAGYVSFFLCCSVSDCESGSVLRFLHKTGETSVAEANQVSVQRQSTMEQKQQELEAERLKSNTAKLSHCPAPCHWSRTPNALFYVFARQEGRHPPLPLMSRVVRGELLSATVQSRSVTSQSTDSREEHVTREIKLRLLARSAS